MSKAADKEASAAVFFALGDVTRLSLVEKLGEGAARSATSLAEGGAVSRQAVTKHLKVLEGAGLVSTVRQGKEVLYVLDAGAVDDARAFLDGVSAGWDRAIARLKKLVEEG